MRTTKRASTEVAPDQIRRDLIQWFYNQNKSGRAALGIQDLCNVIKEAYG